MSKFGVGVGDDFPVDDGNGNRAAGDQGPQDDRAEYEAWKRDRDAERARREQYRAQREEWHRRKDAFKEKVRAAARESFGQDGERRYGSRGSYHRHGFHPFGWSLFALVPILGLVLLVSLIAAIFKSPFVFLALVLAAFLIFGFRRHHFAGHDHGWHDHRWHRHGRHDRDYDVDLKPTSTSDTAPQTPAPAAPQDGGK